MNYVGNDQGCNPGPDTLTRATDGPLDLGSLASNGGPTQTIAQLDGSVGVDIDGLTECLLVGVNGFLGGDLTVDQRGQTRPSAETDPLRCDLGAYEINPLEVELTLTASTGTPEVGASTIPAENILRAASETEALFAPDDPTIQASPLRAFPLRAFPLRAFPLRAFEMGGAPLARVPVRAFFTEAAPLRAFPLRAFPLRAFPLDTVMLSDLVVLTDGGWGAILDGHRFRGRPAAVAHPGRRSGPRVS